MKKKKSPPSPRPAGLRRGEAGQVLLIIILIMVVVLTVGLSVISRSITNIRTSREEASSQKALAAAEAGIEQVLKTNTPIPAGTTLASPPSDTSTTYGATVNQVLGTEVLVNGGSIVPKDEGADIWLVAHNPDGTPNLSSPWTGDLTIFWGSASDICDSDPAINTMAAIEIVVVYDPLPHKFKRFAFDPCSSGVNRRSNNNLSVGLSGVNVITSGGISKSFSYLTPAISVSSGLVVRVVPLYASASVGVVGSIALPSQGSVIESTGVSQGTTRKINVFKGYPQLPIQYFSYGLFSP